MTVRGVLSIVSMTLALAMASCASHMVTISQPINMADYPAADGYLATNMLVVNHVRMALPERWNFKRKAEDDDKSTLFEIRSSGSRRVLGALRLNHFDFSVSMDRISEKYGELAMAKFVDKELHRTEIDQKEAFVIFGTMEEEPKLQRASTVIALDERNVAELTLVGQPSYFTTSPHIAYAISRTFKVMPSDLSERRIKGSFSFRCDDGTMRWNNDNVDTYESNGFTAVGRVGGDIVMAGVSQVSSTRFKDLVKASVFEIPEYETDLRFAGATYRARVIGNDDPATKFVTLALLFKHQDQDYLVILLRKYQSRDGTDPKETHKIPAIQEALDKYFYFDKG